MKKLLVAGIAVTAFGVVQAIAADVHVRPPAGRPFSASNSYPSLLLLLMIPAALGCAWITFQIFKSLPDVLGKIGALLRWGCLWVACFGGGCSYFLRGPYTIQIVSWGGFAWIVGVYVQLTWAKLWEQKPLGATPARGVPGSARLSQPQLDSPPNAFCYELLVVERWLSVINELKRDSYEPHGSGSEVEQIICSVREAVIEEQNIRSSQGNVVWLMRGRSPNRRRAQSSSPPLGHHRQDRHQHRRARCTRPAST
jgi:hypothetical protein